MALITQVDQAMDKADHSPILDILLIRAASRIRLLSNILHNLASLIRSSQVPLVRFNRARTSYRNR